jgi:hypothetical protein
MLRRIKQTTQMLPAINLDAPLNTEELVKLKASKIEPDFFLEGSFNPRWTQILKLCLLVQELLSGDGSELVIGSARNETSIQFFFDLPIVLAVSLTGCRALLDIGQRSGGKKAIQAARIDAEIYARRGRVSIIGTDSFRLQLEFPIEAP